MPAVVIGCGHFMCVRLAGYLARKGKNAYLCSRKAIRYRMLRGMMSQRHEIYAACRCRGLWAPAAVFVLVLMAMAVPGRAAAVSFELDSIAAWGKFPRFCVNTYRWGDKFFNTYDPAYVEGSGKRFNVKLKADSWFDSYNFRLNDGYKMEMFSDPSTAVGFYLTYMALSVGYDMNVSKYFNGGERARKKFNFQFNCSLFAFEYSLITNDIGTHVKRVGYPGDAMHTDIAFKGINTKAWSVDLYYFFNHKRYSQAAAFYYSKLQRRSSGSFFAGLSFWGQRYAFDFKDLVQVLNPALPSEWDYTYWAKNKNYAIRVGYAYNWVFRRGWCLGVWAAPTMGLRKGFINNPGNEHNSFAINSQARLSLIYNYKTKWFFGAVGRYDAALLYDKVHTLMSGTLSMEFSAGFRFDFRKHTPGKDQEPLVF